MDYKAKAEEIVQKMKGYREDENGWKLCKESSDVKVWSKSSPEFSGTLYKSESILEHSPETVFSYLDPLPNSNRLKWDPAVNNLEVVEEIDQDTRVLRTTTKSEFKGLISPREFIDLVVTIKNDDFISTNAQGIDHPKAPKQSDFVRGNNYPCGLICNRLPGESDKCRLVNFIQTELGGMLPTSVVESAFPYNQVMFHTKLREALKNGL